ncbi:MAG: hypothetical protein KDD27_05985, partial [Saprospiraceae bacterium]|nr:hypothetical protein [Saprospiraceae bacterium]
MKKIRTLLSFATKLQDQEQPGSNFLKWHIMAASLVIASLLLPFVSQAQLTGVKTIPGDYATVAAAVTDLNTQGVGAGGVTFDVAAGHTETLSGRIEMTATGTAANPIVFQKSGAGANPVLTSYVGTVATPSVLADGFWVFVGSDYVTIDGIDLQESGANATTAEVMEFGYGLFKASDSDGCQHNLIQNCTITLNRIQNTSWTAPGHNGSTGIAVLNGLNTATGQVTVTAASGSNSFNQFYSNTIQNCNAGIVFIGYAATSPFDLGDTDNDVGGSALSTGNSVLNFGGGAASSPATGIFANNQWGLNVSYNTINNNDGAGVNHATTLRGIFLNSSSTSASVDCNFNNITIHGGATTSQVTFIENGFGSTPAGNTVNINNNMLTGDYLTATSGVFYGIYNNSATPATLNIKDNTISGWTYSGAGLSGSGSNYPIYITGTNAAMTINALDNTVENVSRTGTSGGTTIGIFVSSSLTGLTVNVNGNTVQNMSIDGTGSSSNMYGIQVATGTITVNNNTIDNLKCLKTSGSGSLYGIYNIASSVDENYNFNTVSNLAHNGTGTTYGIYSFTTTGVRTMSNNLVHTITTGGTTVAGIHNASSSPSVFNNKIYNITSTSATTPTVSGILQGSLGSSGTANIYNNLIGDLNAPNANTSAATSPSVRGINITTTTTSTSINVSFNTVYLSATSSGTNFGTAALFATGSTTATTANLTLKNNILVNNSTPNGTGLATAYQRSSNSLANYNTASNNNLFYAGTPSATNPIFYDGSAAQQMLSDFKTLVAPRETVSVTENPSFLSTTGSDATFLHIDPSVPTQLESGGMTVAGIADDYDGDTRNVSTPDVGADEFTGIAIDINPPNIVYTPLDNSCTPGSRMLVATITDASGVPTAGVGLPVCYWSINAPGGPFTAATATSLGSDQYEFTIGAGSVNGDVIHYYIVAQDNAGTPNVGASPPTGAGGFSANPPAAGTPPTTPSSYTNLASLSGTYTVGAAGDYATLTAAVADYNSKCVNGAVVFELLDADYSTNETFPIVINSNPSASMANTLTIRPASAVTATITEAVSPGSIIKLNGADYVIIDGSNNGSSSRDLTISNTTTSTSGNAVLWLSSPATGNGSNNNTVKNCIIEGNSSTTTYSGAYVGGNATISITAAGTELNNNNTFDNNLFRKTQYGLALFGFAANSPDQNNVVSNNNFGTAVAGEGFSLLAINADRQDGLVVAGNEVQNVANATNTSSTPFGGIRLLDFKNGLCYNNYIHDLSYTGSSTPKIYGIAVTSTTYTTVGNPSNAQVYNNMVSNITSTGISGVWNMTGILASAGYGDKYYYNSVHLSGQLNNSSSGLSAAFANGDGNIGSACTNIDVRNNIFNVTGSSLGGNVWAYYTTATTLAGSTLDYNLLRCAGTGATNNTGRFNGTNYTTLAAWQAATSMDANSLDIEPIFVSMSDLHLATANNPLLDGAGTPIAGVTLDIDGDTRDASTPDIGADEFTSTAAPCAGTPDPGNTLTTANPVCPNENFTLSLSNSPLPGTGFTYQWQSSPDNVTYTDITGETNPTLTTSQTAATWYQCMVTCTNSSMMAPSTPLEETMNPVYQCYCASNATNTADTKIDSVFFNTIVAGSLASTCETYTDNTALNTSVDLGSTYDLRIRNGSCSGNHYGAYVAAYIDYNQNGDYTDAGELVYSFGPTTGLNTIPIGNVTIPGSATLGTTGMRIVFTEGSSVPPPCGTYSYGETEDYLVTIAMGTNCTGTPDPGNTVSSANPACSGANFTLSLANSPLPGSGLTYQWQSSPDNVTYTDITGETNPSLTTSQAAATWYQCVVTCTNSGMMATSTPLEVMLNPDACQCGAFCTASSTTAGCTGDEFISNVTFVTINNSSVCSDDADGYTDYTNLGTTISTGSTYTLNVTNGAGFSGDQCRAWFDWNANGDFTDAGEEFILTSGNNLDWTVDVLVPGGATLGTTRMRVRVTYTTGMAPCGVASFGETEDYCVTIEAGSSCTGTPDPGNTVSSANPVCSGANFTLSLANSPLPGLGLTYQWQSSPDNVTYTDITGETNATLTTSQAAATWYQCVVTCTSSGMMATSTPVEVLMNTNPCECAAYCIPASTGTSCITNVTFNGINNTTAGCSPGNYSLESATTNVEAGATYALSVTTDNSFNAIVSVWIDYNQDGTFDASEWA